MYKNTYAIHKYVYMINVVNLGHFFVLKLFIGLSITQLIDGAIDRTIPF